MPRSDYRERNVREDRLGVILKSLMRSRLTNALAVLLSFAALLFLFSGHLKLDKLTTPRLLPLAPDGGNALFVSQGGFAENAVWVGVMPPRIGLNLRHFGSWLGADFTMGKAQSAWFQLVPEFSLQVSGYPNSNGCQLYIETETPSGAVQRIEVPGDDPGETWQVRTISLPPTATRFRIVAIDAGTGPGGWVGFSQPFQFIEDARELWKQAGLLTLVALTASAALVALLFPGLLLRRVRPRLEFVWIPVPGFMALASVALLCWIGPHTVGVRRISQLFLGPLFAYALYHSLRFPLTAYTTKWEQRVLLATLLLSALSVSKASYSLGPIGELFGGRISRTIEVGDRSDSRIPYHVLQLIAARSDPHGSLATTLFGDWGFSARTPLASLTASPVVLAIPVRVPQGLPEQIWTVFDPEGFSAFRVVMIVIACCSLISAFGVANLFLDEQWALLAFLVTATTPFVVHETYFTWPKLESAWFVLLAAYLILRGRLLMAGLFWGLGYLCHPLALLSAPALLGIVFLSQSKRVSKTASRFGEIYAWGLQAAALIPGLTLCIAIWVLVNRHDFNQISFLWYAQMADGDAKPSLAAWLQSRWSSVANTLLPLSLFLLHGDHHSINSIFRSSPPVVRFYFQYWNTVPFGVGITYFLFMVRCLYVGFVEARAWLMLVLVIPFACFSVYWGTNSAGMLREGLQPWVLSLLLFSVAMWRRLAAHKVFCAACSVALLLRGVETLLMLLLPSIWTNHRFVNTQFILSDSVALFTMAVSAGWLYVLTYRHASSLCRSPSESAIREAEPLGAPNEKEFSGPAKAEGKAKLQF
jgi:hypothetical protein